MSTLRDRFRCLFKPPVFENEERTRQSYLLYMILWIAMAVVTAVTLTLSINQPQWSLRWIGTAIVVDVLSLLLLKLNRNGYIKTAGVLWIIIAWLIITVLAGTGGGINAAIAEFYPVIVVVAGILLERKGGFIAAGLCCITGLGLILLGLMGMLPPSMVRPNPVSLWLTFTAVILIIAGLQYLSNKTLREALERAHRENRERETAEESLHSSEELITQTLDQLIKSEERYMLAVEGSNDAIFDFNEATGDIYFSDRIYDILGEERRDYEFTKVQDLKELVTLEDYQKVVMMINKDIAERKPLFCYELCVQNKNQEIRWILLRGRAIYDGLGNLERLTGSLTNITERMTNQQKIYQMAYYDILTGLPNLAMLSEALEQELLKCRNEGCRSALIFMDIDNFKVINDTFGHSFGNQVLCEISTKLNGLNFANTLTTRYGGDEFIILLSNIESRAMVETFIGGIMKTFETPIQIGFQNFDISLSVGVSIYPDDGDSSDELLKNADIAMYKAKDMGKKRFVFFDPAMIREITVKSKLEADLRKALTNEEFVLYYQPQINIADNDCCGFEALIRWPDPQKGVIPPLEFIPLAEETGLIIELGKWVLYNACIFGIKLNQSGFTQFVTVNVSPVQLNQGNFVEIVATVIRDTGIDAGHLGLEITETALMSSLEENIVKIRKLQSLGVKILMDDFGTGYSSLYYLKYMPIDVLKIDKSFINDIGHDQYSYHLTETIVGLAHRLGIKVVAEGVETREQLEILERFHCDMIQGFLISKPVAEPEVLEILETGRV